MCSVNELNGGTWGFVIETRKSALATTGRNMVLSLSKILPFPVIVTSAAQKPPHDTGDKVVVKDSLLGRSQKLTGKRIVRLSDDTTLYRLKRSL